MADARGRGKLFEQAVSRVLSEWPALQIAVEHSFGGASSREKAEWLVEVTAEFIQNTDHVNSGDINEYLGVLMDQEFDTLIEDGSLDTVAEQLYDLWIKFDNGQLQEVQEKSVDSGLEGKKLSKEDSTTKESVDPGWTIVTRKH